MRHASPLAVEGSPLRRSGPSPLSVFKLSPPFKFGLLFAVAGAGLPGGIAAGPAAQAAPIGVASAPVGGLTYTVPASIDATGTTDVSDALNDWIANHTTDGTAEEPNRLVFDGTYRVEYGLMIGNA